MRDQIRAKEAQIELVERSIAGLLEEATTGRSLTQITEDLTKAQEAYNNALSPEGRAIAAGRVAELSAEKEAIEDIVASLKAVESFQESRTTTAELDLIFDVDQIDRLKSELSDVEGLINNLANLGTPREQLAEYEAEWVALGRRIESLELDKTITEFTDSLEQTRERGLFFGQTELDITNSQLSAIEGQIRNLDSLTRDIGDDNNLGVVTAEVERLEQEWRELNITAARQEITEAINDLNIAIGSVGQQGSIARLGDIFGDTGLEVLQSQASAIESTIKTLVERSASATDETIIKLLEDQIADLIPELNEVKQSIESIERPVGSLTELEQRLTEARTAYTRAATDGARQIAQVTIDEAEKAKAAIEAIFALEDIGDTLNSALSRITNIQGLDSSQGLSLSSILFGDEPSSVIEAQINANKTALQSTLEVITDLQVAQTAGNGLTQEQSAALVEAQASIVSYNDEIVRLQGSLDQLEFPVGSLVAAEKELSNARDGLQRAATDFEIEQAKRRVAVAEQAVEDIQDKFRSLKDVLDEIAATQTAQVANLVNQTDFGISTEVIRANIQQQLAIAEEGLREINALVQAQGPSIFEDPDNQLLLQLEAARAEVELLRGALGQLNDIELRDLNNSFTQLNLEIGETGTRSAEQTATLIRTRSQLQQDIANLQSQLTTLEVDTPEFERLSAILEANRKQLADLPTGFENVSSAAKETAESVTNTAEALETLVAARSFGIEIQGVGIDQEFLEQAAAGVKLFEAYEEQLAQLTTAFNLSGDAQDFFQGKLSALRTLLDGLISAGFTDANAVVQDVSERVEDAGGSFEKLAEGIEVSLTELNDLKDVSPELATELEKLGVNTGDYETELGKLLPLLQEQIALLEEDEEIAEANREAIDRLKLAVAGLAVEYANLTQSELSKLNEQLELNEQRARLLGDDYDLLAARTDLARAAVNAYIDEQIAANNAINESDPELQKLLGNLQALRDLDDPLGLEDSRETLSMVTGLTSELSEELKKLGVDLGTTEQAYEGLISDLESTIAATQANIISIAAKVAAGKASEAQLEAERKRLLELQVELANTRAEYEALPSTLDKVAASFAKVAQVASITGGIVNSALKFDVSTANDALSSIGNLANSVAAVGGPIGAIAGTVGSIINTVGSAIGDLSNGLKQVRKEIASINAELNFVDVGNIVQTERVSRGGIVGALGLKKTQIDKEASDFGLRIAQAIDSGFTSGFENAFKVALSGGSLADIEATLNASLGQIIQSTVTQALVKSLAIEGALSSQITAYAEAIADGNLEGAKAIAQGIRAAFPELAKQFQEGSEIWGEFFGDATINAFDGAADAAQERFREVFFELINENNAALDEFGRTIGGIIKLAEDLSIDIDLNEASFATLNQRAGQIEDLLQRLAEAGVELTEDQLEGINNELDRV